MEASIDRDETRRAISLWMDPGDHHELRVLPSGRSRLLSASNLDSALAAIAELSQGSHGVYLTLNPVRADLGNRAARERDVTTRKFLLVDVDTKRPERDSSATDAEKERSFEVCERVRQYLDRQGWPAPIVLDSGNGFHLLYRIDLPNDALAKQWLKKCLLNLSDRFSNEHAEIDTKVHNASRISKIPGTWVRKGKDTTDRPHRMAKLVAVPVALTIVQSEQIQALAGLNPKSDPPTKPVDRNPAEHITIDRVKDNSYGRVALEREIGAVALAKEGERNDTLNKAAFNLGQLVESGHLKEDEVLDALDGAARSIGLNDAEIEKTVMSGYNAGRATPRTNVPDPNKERVEFRKGKLGSEQAKVTEDGKRKYSFDLIVRGDRVMPKKVRWLWPGRIPIGFLTLMAGRTGVGKSFVTLDFSARLTTGDATPDTKDGECLEPANVLIISEDSHEYVLAPRLLELRADMSRVSFMTFEAMTSFELADTDMLDDAYQESGSPKLIVIDPPTNFLGAKDEHKNAEVRGVLMRIAVWAMRHDIAVVMITHCNKGLKKDMAALDRIIGSVAWASTSRIAHILAPDPDDPSKCLFVCLKNNIGEIPKGLSYRIKKTDTLAVVDWLGEVDITGDQALHGAAKPRRIVASEWLIEMFRKQHEWLSTDLFSAGTNAGVSKNAIYEAKDLLCLPRARRQVEENGDIKYFWWVPPDWPHLFTEQQS